MQPCPSCQKEVPERALYCPSCGAQAKCKQCRDLLEPNALFCGSCGTSIGGDNSTPPNSQLAPITPSVHNVIEFSESRSGRRFRAEMTNEGLESVSGSLAYFLAANSGLPSSTSRKEYVVNNSVQGVPPSDAKHGDVSQNVTPSPTDANVPEMRALPVNNDQEILSLIFREATDGKLRLSDPLLKQSSQRDFVERLSVLFLYAHELSGQKFIPRNDLKVLLTDAKVYDGNSRTWVAKTKHLEREGDTLLLARPGRQHAQLILAEYQNDNIGTEWSFDSKPKRRSSRANSSEDGDSNETDETKSSQRRKSTGAMGVIKELLSTSYFEEGRTPVQIKEEANRLGHSLETRRINEALLKLTKDKALTRPPKEGSVWKYKKP